MRNIKLPKLRLLKEYTTHQAMLIKYITKTDGVVLEFGSGPFSTPIIHWLCAKNKRLCYTFEDDQNYYQFARQFRSRTHKIRFVEDWDKLEFKDRYSVVLIDHITERRAIDAIRLKDQADFILLHDTEDIIKNNVYGYDRVWPHFKHVYHWKDCKPWTSVVSNFYAFENN